LAGPAKVKKGLDGSAARWVSMAAAKYRELAGQHHQAVSALNADHGNR
jgi:hypothetical protein